MPRASRYRIRIAMLLFIRRLSPSPTEPLTAQPAHHPRKDLHMPLPDLTLQRLDGTPYPLTQLAG
ncbi:hypothetical protein OFM81_31585, partial [Escherichia coli]|nr:hypothetical protein [Escherichia coli]